MPITTCDNFPKRRMAGETAFVMKSAHELTWASTSDFALTLARLGLSRPKALMTRRPEYASSIPPVSSPKTAWRRAAMASVFADTAFVATKAASENARNMPVSMRLCSPIMITDPMRVQLAMISCRSPRCITSEILSRSFVAWLMVSPGLCASKYESGNSASLSAMRSRSWRLSLSAKLAMTSVCVA